MTDALAKCCFVSKPGAKTWEAVVWWCLYEMSETVAMICATWWLTNASALYLCMVSFIRFVWIQFYILKYNIVGRKIAFYPVFNEIRKFDMSVVPIFAHSHIHIPPPHRVLYLRIATILVHVIIINQIRKYRAGAAHLHTYPTHSHMHKLCLVFWLLCLTICNVTGVNRSNFNIHYK